MVIKYLFCVTVSSFGRTTYDNRKIQKDAKTS